MLEIDHHAVSKTHSSYLLFNDLKYIASCNELLLI